MPRRMLKKCLLIAKINRWNNSFQHMYDMLYVKVDRLTGKTFFLPKNTKKAFFGGHNSRVSWLWMELYAKLLGLGQLLGCPWKLWGITVQTSYWEGRWHQNCGYTSPILFFLQPDTEISEKRNFRIREMHLPILQECVCVHWSSLSTTHGGWWKNVCEIPGESIIATLRSWPMTMDRPFWKDLGKSTRITIPP